MRQFTDAQLTAIAQASADRSAFDELFRRYQQKLKGFLLSKMSAAAADDVMQETYIKAFMNIKKFRAESAFSTWLFAIAMNEYKQFVRKVGVFDKLKDALFRQPRLEHSQHEVDALIDFSKRAADLSEAQYSVYVLSRVYGYSHGEIAGRQDMPLGTVKTYLLQAEKRLKVSANE
ncbi:RNA polymerase sigma factor [Pseudidiomarina insulisalsae]|uniref:RNA polymerase subunit sigma-70 n=1 Tax=Pseudidiomarina insulisalsae TaxID=575789 RepID=A0A432YF51_9GAMM|nr:sigma-70 family RNA polymerase sigma factor [Pseudidiomarina insulisalsae]RUO59550.1 hypothetical protein CWI71_09030 [Pseudidiomarina insulisalsae]